MKQLIVVLCGFILFFSCKGKEQTTGEADKINAKELIAIVDDSSFTAFRSLTNELGYPVVDSSVDDNGGIIFITRQLSATGNSLGVTASAQLVVSDLYFTTYDKGLYQRLKKQIPELNFKSVSKETNPDAEDFERIGMYISAAVIEKERRPDLYEFAFLRMKY